MFSFPSPPPHLFLMSNLFELFFFFFYQESKGQGTRQAPGAGGPQSPELEAPHPA